MTDPFRRRVRQHVNPLSDKYAQPALPPDWSQVFANPHLPLHVDIGCGKGDFLRAMASQLPDWNFLGLEIREPLVVRALLKQRHGRPGKRPADDTRPEAARNLHFIFCNANHSLQPLLAQWPGGCPLQRVSIQFPDPWFKKRHQKRRVVQPELVAAIASLMSPGGWVWLQSDVETVCQDMCDHFDDHPAFERTERHWLASSPFGARTDRERVTEEKGLPIYRALYVRQSV